MFHRSNTSHVYQIITIAVVGVAVVAMFVPGVDAARILFLDGAAPGGSPGTGWQDLSGTSSPLALVGNTSYDAAEQAYSLPGSVDHLATVGADESNYDFAWDSPYTMVAYIKPNGAGQHGNGLIQKNNGESNRGYAMQPSFPGSQKVSVNSILAHSNGARSFSRDQQEGVVNGDPNQQYHLIVTTHDGSGHSHNMNMYYNGVKATREDYGGEPSNSQNQDITNDDDLRIGWDAFSGPPSKVAGFAGHVAIIEIWDEDLGAEYAASRWNGGNVARAPEPTSVMLLVAGLLGLLGSTLLRQNNR